MFDVERKVVLDYVEKTGWFKPEPLARLRGISVSEEKEEKGLVVYGDNYIHFHRDWQSRIRRPQQEYFPTAALLDGLLGEFYFRMLDKRFNQTAIPRVHRIFVEIGGMVTTGELQGYGEGAVMQRLRGMFEHEFGSGSPLISSADAIIGSMFAHIKESATESKEPDFSKAAGPILAAVSEHNTRSRSTAVAYLVAESKKGGMWGGARRQLQAKADFQHLDLAPYARLWKERGPRRALELFEDFELGERERLYHG